MAYTVINGKLVRTTRRNPVSGYKQRVSFANQQKAAAPNARTMKLDRSLLSGPTAAGDSELAADKGKFNGSCNITRCQRPDSATWYNHSTRAFYCPECAKDLNNLNHRDAMELYGHALCTDATQAEYLWDFIDNTPDSPWWPDFKEFRLDYAKHQFASIVSVKDGGRTRVTLRGTGELLTDADLLDLNAHLTDYCKERGGQHLRVKRLPNGRDETQTS